MSFKKVNNAISWIFLTPLIIILGIIKIVIINPIVWLVGNAIWKRNSFVWHQYEYKIHELRSQLKYQEAIALCEEGMVHFGNGLSENGSAVLYILINKIVLNAMLSQYTISEKDMLQFEEMLINSPYKTSRLLIDYYFGKALLLENRNHLVQAKKYYKKIIKTISEESIDDELLKLYSCLHLANLHFRMKEPSASLNYLAKANPILLQIKNNSDKSSFAKVYSNYLDYYASNYFMLGDLENSLEFFNQAKMTLQNVNQINIDYADILINISRIFIEMREYELARSNLSKAKEIYESAKIVVYTIDYTFALCDYEEGNYKKTLQILLDIYENIFPHFQMEYFGEIDLLIISKIVVVYSKLNQSVKSLEYLNILNEELLKTIQGSANKLSDSERYYFLNSIYEVLLNVFELLPEYKLLTYEYRKAIYSFRLLMKSINESAILQHIPTHEKFIEHIPNNGVVVDIIRLGNKENKAVQIQYYAFILDENIRIILIDDEGNIEGKYYERYIKLIRRKAVDVQSFKNYWDKIDKEIEDKTTIYLVAEGYYNFINIENFITPQNNYYYEEKKIILVLNILTMAEFNSAEKGEIFIIGNPRFELQVQSEYKMPPGYLPSEFNYDLSDLPYTEIEGNLISNIATSAGYVPRELYGEDVIKKRLKDIVSPKVLHIATHGFNFQKSSLNSRMTEWEHQTGLLLANSVVKKGGKNYFNAKGMLYSKNIKGLDLKNTKLGVLSACGSGKEILVNTGDTIGIQKAMFSAGVDEMLVVLWEIEDKVAQEFMVTFYSEWVKNENSLNALGKAKAMIKDKYIYPFYWAGFRIVNNSLLTKLEKEIVQ